MLSYEIKDLVNSKELKKISFSRKCKLLDEIRDIEKMVDSKNELKELQKMELKIIKVLTA